MCGQSVTSILVKGEEKTISVPETFPDDDGADLSCLDHAYFITEFRSLMERASGVSQRWCQQGYTRGRHGSVGIDAALHLLHNVSASLHSIHELMVTGAQFDPHDTVQRLYRFQESLIELSNATEQNVGAKVETAAARLVNDIQSQATEQAWGDDDDDPDLYDDEDEYDFEVGYRAPTSGRAPNRKRR